MTNLNITVSVPHAAARDSLLNDAEESIRPHALAFGHGILVTRHSPTLYSVSTSAAVPVGETHEASLL
ncbi:hypothetical protein J2W21_001745 [Sinomonas atrocyanea]|jgi:hypothetical protein|uniref:hypothetical protein n=1 Tax=Sinomonas atrocyanea TaxID=37927 RepID=UPI002787B612|nr:hypothetical protein [Sinomonas atrocyanea]MDP9884235.1 hypothetical protein [Sinomonas atrocyanea]